MTVYMIRVGRNNLCWNIPLATYFIDRECINKQNIYMNRKLHFFQINHPPPKKKNPRRQFFFFLWISESLSAPESFLKSPLLGGSPFRTCPSWAPSGGRCRACSEPRGGWPGRGDTRTQDSTSASTAQEISRINKIT